MAEEDLRKKLAEVLGKLPRPIEVEKYKPFGSLTPEEEHWVMKIIQKAGEINALTFIHPLIDHKRMDAYIRRKVAELEKIIPKVRH